MGVLHLPTFMTACFRLARVHPSATRLRPSRRRLVGTPGFEPGTSCAPCKHATRLRHVPRYRSSVSLGRSDDKRLDPSSTARGLRRSRRPDPGASDQTSEADSHPVFSHELVHLGLGKSASAQRSPERPPAASLEEERSKQAERNSRDQPDNKANDAEDRDQPLQSPSLSRFRSMKLPMLIPLLPISSRRLIM
jgi:hypothetical protein